MQMVERRFLQYMSKQGLGFSSDPVVEYSLTLVKFTYFHELQDRPAMQGRETESESDVMH